MNVAVGLIPWFENLGCVPVAERRLKVKSSFHCTQFQTSLRDVISSIIARGTNPTDTFSASLRDLD